MLCGFGIFLYSLDVVYGVINVISFVLVVEFEVLLIVEVGFNEFGCIKVSVSE